MGTGLRLWEGVEHVSDEGLGEVAGEAVDGGGVFLDGAGEVLGGLELLAPGEGLVAVEDVAVVGGEGDGGGDADEVAGGLAAGGVVGEGGDGFGEDGAAEGGVGGVGGVVGGAGYGGKDAVAGGGVEFADYGLREGDFGAEGLDAGGEDGDGDGSDVRGDVGGGACLVIAAAGCCEKEKQGEAAHLD